MTAAGKTVRFNKKNELMIVTLAVSFSFVLMVFSPALLYAADPDSFMVEYRFAALPMAAAALITALLLTGILNILLLIKEGALHAVSRVLLGLLLAFFVQSAFMENSMPIVIPNDVRYHNYKAAIIANAVIFFTVVLMPTAVHMIFRLTKRQSGFGAKAITAASAALFAVNLVWAAAAYIRVDTNKYKGVHKQYLSYEPAMSLSKEGNIVVFLTDRLDGVWMDDLLEGYPELNNEFSGFTMYRNCISSGTSTFPVVPDMLTMNTYGGEEWAEYLSSSWSGDTLPKKLKANGYSVYLMPDCITTLGSTAQVKGQCDNIAERSSEPKLQIFGKRGIFPVMFRLSLSRMAPYCFKHQLTYWLGGNFTKLFLKYDDTEDALGPATNAESDMKFYSYLTKHGLNADSTSKTFTFIHLNCFHAVSEPISALYGFNAAPDSYSTARGDMEIIFTYMRMMKELGIYDNSTIIVMGDHGRAPYELKGSSTKLNGAITSGLLIKPAGAENVPLRFDNNSELSIENFPAGILEYAGIDRSGAGNSYNDVIREGITGDRILRSYDFAGYGRMIYQALYRINGDARDFDCWECMEE